MAKSEYPINTFSMSTRKGKSNMCGVTVMEMIIVVAIVSILGTVAIVFGKDILYFGDLFEGSLNEGDRAHRVLQPVAQEVRSAAPSSTGTYPIEEAESDSFIFFSDINDDGLEERVRYFLDGTNFRKGVTIPSGSPLVYDTGNETVTTAVQDVHNGVNAVFSYYDSSYDGSSAALVEPFALSEIRLVKVELVIDADPALPPNALTVTTQVTIRNLKDNL